MKVLLAVAIVTVAAFSIYIGLNSAEEGADASSQSMDEMSIDMDPTGNTGTSIGSRESCARINENGFTDADEDAPDTVEFDVTVLNLPAGNLAIGTTFRLLFPAPNQMTVTQVATPYAAANAWSTSDVSDPAQSDGDYLHTVFDVVGAGTSGSGAISRLTLQTDPGASTGVFPLTLTTENHIDILSELHAPITTNNGWIAINEPCPSGEPSPSPTSTPSPTVTPTPTPGASDTPGPSGTATSPPSGTLTPAPTGTNGATPEPTGGPGPTSTPGPTATPSGEPRHGDIDCDADGDAVDALAILRFVGGLQDELVSCAQPASASSGEAIHGDVDCDGDVDAVDALAILRFVVGLLDELAAC